MVELERAKDLDGVTYRERWTWRKGGTWRDRKELGLGRRNGGQNGRIWREAREL